MALDSRGKRAPAEDDDKRRSILRRAATESLVLLRNSRDVLPLNAAELSSIAVLGPNAADTTIQGGGSSRCRGRRCKTLLEALRESLQPHGVKVEYQQGCAPEMLPAEHVTEELRSIMMVGNGDAFGQPSDFHVASRLLEVGIAFAVSCAESECFRRFLMPRLHRLGVRLTTPEEAAAARAREDAGPRCLSRCRRKFGMAGICSVLALIVAALAELLFFLGKLTSRHLWIALGGAGALMVCILATLLVRRLCSCCRRLRAEKLLSAAESAASEADACILAIGTHGFWEVESVDQPHAKLASLQTELIDRVVKCARGPVVVVLNVGSPKEIPWITDVDAVLLAHFGGEETAVAIADTLLGIATPAGRLPTTWPQSYDSVPAVAACDNERGLEAKRRYEVLYGEGIRVGYRGYVESGPSCKSSHPSQQEPAFFFGHGLSYTKFAYHDVQITQEAFSNQPGGPVVVVRLKVRNTGPRPGAEVVQLYSRSTSPAGEIRAWDPAGEGVGIPLRVLCGFKRTRVLAAGAEESVQLTVGQRALGQGYDTASQRWVGPLRGSTVLLTLGASAAPSAVLHSRSLVLA
eukprot:TRINITY_DN52022_c0_g1_i1.p1 TRINITY_DN52022_c0_g1~~TRINITY_DN52022_c0_g1_i1.p1  ORF type:complete len:620 (+),score=116.06 TRINITY_DN52022_c0_g1_i1:128-1861(+)